MTAFHLVRGDFSPDVVAGLASLRQTDLLVQVSEVPLSLLAPHASEDFGGNGSQDAKLGLERQLEDVIDNVLSGLRRPRLALRGNGLCCTCHTTKMGFGFPGARPRMGGSAADPDEE